MLLGRRGWMGPHSAVGHSLYLLDNRLCCLHLPVHTGRRVGCLYLLERRVGCLYLLHREGGMSVPAGQKGGQLVGTKDGAQGGGRQTSHTLHKENKSYNRKVGWNIQSPKSWRISLCKTRKDENGPCKTRWFLIDKVVSNKSRRVTMRKRVSLRQEEFL
jgi:hypothetical protein